MSAATGLRNENDDDANALSDLADGAAQVMPVNRSGGGGAVGQQMTTPANTEKKWQTKLQRLRRRALLLGRRPIQPGLRWEDRVVR